MSKEKKNDLDEKLKIVEKKIEKLSSKINDVEERLNFHFITLHQIAFFGIISLVIAFFLGAFIHSGLNYRTIPLYEGKLKTINPYCLIFEDGTVVTFHKFSGMIPSNASRLFLDVYYNAGHIWFQGHTYRMLKQENLLFGSWQAPSGDNAYLFVTFVDLNEAAR